MPQYIDFLLHAELLSVPAANARAGWAGWPGSACGPTRTGLCEVSRPSCKELACMSLFVLRFLLVMRGFTLPARIAMGAGVHRRVEADMIFRNISFESDVRRQLDTPTCDITSSHVERLQESTSKHSKRRCMLRIQAKSYYQYNYV